MTKLEKAIEALRQNPNISLAGIMRATGTKTSAAASVMKSRAQKKLNSDQSAKVPSPEKELKQPQTAGITMEQRGEKLLIEIPMSMVTELVLKRLIVTKH